jgi:hypothetical protein
VKPIRLGGIGATGGFAPSAEVYVDITGGEVCAWAPGYPVIRKLLADSDAESWDVVLQIEGGALGEADPKRSGGGNGDPGARLRDDSAAEEPRGRIMSFNRSSAVSALGGEIGFECTEGVAKEPEAEDTLNKKISEWAH